MSAEPIVYLNGEFLPQSQAKVSVLDRGFVFADGIYEVIPAYGGRLFRLGEHLQRLQNSLDGVRLANPLDDIEWDRILGELIKRNGGGDQSLYLQITRGVAKRDHGFPPDTPATVFAMSNPLKPVDAALLKSGVKAITLEDIRWRFCNIKSIALLPNVLLRQQALEQGAAEAILIRNGLVTEGSASNVFIVRKGVIMTPPKSEFLLPGITRDLIVELSQRHGVPCEERDIPEAWLEEADEMWLSSSLKELLPITTLNDKSVGSGSPGPVWAKMFDIFQSFKDDIRKTG